jgi:hypothetical protein
MAWIDWDGYIDANITNAFAEGTGGTNKDGVFNEMRGFFDAMPDLAKTMAEQMGMGGNTVYIDRICQSLYEKNLPPIKNMLQKRKWSNERKASYYNISSMILGFADVQELTQPATSDATQKRFKDYKMKMDEINLRAKEITATKGFAESMKYRTTMWKRFEAVVEGEVETQELTLAQIEKGEFDTSGAPPQAPIRQVTRQTLDETESVLRDTHHKKRQRKSFGRPEDSLLQGGQGSQQGQDDDDTVPPPTPLN